MQYNVKYQQHVGKGQKYQYCRVWLMQIILMRRTVGGPRFSGRGYIWDMSSNCSVLRRCSRDRDSHLVPKILDTKRKWNNLKYKTLVYFIINCLNMIEQLVFLLLSSESKFISRNWPLMGCDLLSWRKIQIEKVTSKNIFTIERP